MKRALIVASVGVLASTVWVVSANAQANINPNVYPGNMGERYGARAPAYAPAPAYGPSRRYARRAASAPAVVLPLAVTKAGLYEEASVRSRVFV